MEEVTVRFIGGPLDGQEKTLIRNQIEETLGGDELQDYSLGATRYRLDDLWIKNDEEFAEYRVINGYVISRDH